MFKELGKLYKRSHLASGSYPQTPAGAWKARRAKARAVVVIILNQNFQERSRSVSGSGLSFRLLGETKKGSTPGEDLFGHSTIMILLGTDSRYAERKKLRTGMGLIEQKTGASVRIFFHGIVDLYGKFSSLSFGNTPGSNVFHSLQAVCCYAIGHLIVGR
ncbi:MAG: hypothetical protein KDD10_04825 [Phaeodactylibacter sp.]|nr:hypothetical protein [Phaeodactylibacter sp.]MCB9296366.1 hypothetical protein [Lewinellaceae bacterium]